MSIITYLCEYILTNDLLSIMFNDLLIIVMMLPNKFK